MDDQKKYYKSMYKYLCIFGYVWGAIFIFVAISLIIYSMETKILILFSACIFMPTGFFITLKWSKKILEKKGLM